MDKHTKPISEIVLHHSGFNSFKYGEHRGKHIREVPLEYIVKAITRAHKMRGWDDIGYHYLVHPDPRQGWCAAREPKYRGAHVKGMNDGRIGVCLIGDYSNFNIKAEECSCGVDGIAPCEQRLPFWFWGALLEVQTHLFWYIRNHDSPLDMAWKDNYEGPAWNFATHSELLPGHTDCGKGVIQRFVNELNEHAFQ